MSIPEIILTVIAAVILAASAVCTVSWLIALRSDKENAFVFSLSNLVINGVLIIMFILFAATGDSYRLFYLLISISEIISIPMMCGAILTTKGICTVLFIKKRYIPLSELSYQYAGRDLEIYQKGKSRPAKYQLCIKDTKTIKMLADWYPKHDYENPLIK